MKKKLLMHACCGPCFTYIQSDLEKNGLKKEDGTYMDVDYTACFYNPNIHPKVEYERRKEAFITLCNLKEVNYVLLDEYDLKNFVINVINNVGEDKEYKIRCHYCYYIRLKKVFEYAKENSYDIVSTTLTISPYQNHELIKKVGKELEKEYGIEFMYVDYREHYKEGQNMARELGIYMQKYCGCFFSLDNSSYFLKKQEKNVMPEWLEDVIKIKTEVKRIEDIHLINSILNEKDNGTPCVISDLKDYDIFCLKKEDEIISVIVLLKISFKDVQINEIITKSEYRNQGFGTKLLKQICGNYKQKYNNMIVGTTGNYLPFFIQNGFNSFLRQEGNILYYSKELQKKK